jgi:hypothetical protein
MATGRVDRKPDLRKNVVGLNLTPELEPNGFRVGFGCPSGFVNGFLSGFEFFGVFCRVSFEFRVHPRVKNETRTQTRFCAGRVRVTGAKMHPNPHPSGAKPAGYPKSEPKLPSLVETLNLVAS